MGVALTEFDTHLLDRWQRDLPLVPRPFAAMAAALGCEEAEVIARLKALRAAGAVARVGATCRPNTIGASTLAALAVPDWDTERVGELVSREKGVNHAYLREHAWNLWFVATAADRRELTALLGRIGDRTGLPLVDLPLLRPYNIDLGFPLHGIPDRTPEHVEPDRSVLCEDDRPLIQALSTGLALKPRPFAALALSLGRDEAGVIARIDRLARSGILTRVGVIVRHRALGWRSNAMVVWDLPDARIDAAGRALARHPGVTLSYRRRTVPGIWEFGLFSMIHSRSRSDALAILTSAAALPELTEARHRVLFSVRCFKQTGARLARETAA